MSSAIQSLVVVEHDGRAVKRPSLGAIALARQLGPAYGVVVVGSAVAPIAESVRLYGAVAVWTADHPDLAETLADRHAAVVAQLAKKLGVTTVLGTTGSYTRDLLPRVAALLDAPMATDVIAAVEHNGIPCFKRLLNAGRLSATVRLDGPIRVLSARSTAFPPPTPGDAASPVENFPVDAATLPRGTQFVSRERPVSTRPDFAEARIIVSGGRPLKDKENFDRLIGGLADDLGGAVGATRAAVDAGLAANQCQIGQTAATVAPELYIAIGISGAVQHMAGIMDSKVIVAINRDPDAPIFQVA
ncbi:MAG TPA: electron transfer flavoprotein subunit alpha/FixB family protein, partial [Candidatus Didemnitutus sp.]|nr:electron transfer flavoprotein subunit alpha/FixB family protein [Candidatus Didemnitutus sp.]